MDGAAPIFRDASSIQQPATAGFAAPFCTFCLIPGGIAEAVRRTFLMSPLRNDDGRLRYQLSAGASSD